MAHGEPHTETGGQDAFTTELQNKLLETSDLVSSGQTKLEERITESISGVQKSQEASAARIESEAGREIDFQREQFGQQRTTALESRRGFATNVAALQQLDERTSKSLRDLEQRKQELILQGESVAAGKIAELEFNAIQFEQTATQNVFNNLLSLSSQHLQGRQVGVAERTEDRLAASQTREERASVIALGTEFGIEVKEGDTLETIAARVAPLASADRQRKIQSELADIKRSQAEAAKALQGATNLAEDPLMVDMLAEAALNNPGILDLVKDIDLAARIVNKVTELNQPRVVEEDELRGSVQELFNANTPFNEALLSISSNQVISNKADAERILREVFDRPAREGGVLKDLTGLLTGQTAEERTQSKVRKEISDLESKLRKGVGNPAILNRKIDEARRKLTR